MDNRLNGLCSTKCCATSSERLGSTRTGEARDKQHLQGDAARGPAPHKAGIGGLSFALFALAGPLNVDTEDAGQAWAARAARGQCITLTRVGVIRVAARTPAPQQVAPSLLVHVTKRGRLNAGTHNPRVNKQAPG